MTVTVGADDRCAVDSCANDDSGSCVNNDSGSCADGANPYLHCCVTHNIITILLKMLPFI